MYKVGKQMCDTGAAIIICLMKIKQPLKIYLYYIPKKRNIKHKFWILLNYKGLTHMAFKTILTNDLILGISEQLF